MCGIIGFVGITTRNEIHEVFTSNESRGGHAWGWAKFNNDNNIQLHKEPGKIKKINLPKGERISGTFIGHTRFATHGKPEQNQNNHPHSSATIALVHNGVLSNKHEDQKTECDSEAILKMLINEPHATKSETIKALKKVAGELEGSFRILLINSATPQWMYVVTDELDPPYLCMDKMRVWIASEAKDLPKTNVKFRLMGKSIYTINNIGRIEQTFFKKKERVFQTRDWHDWKWTRPANSYTSVGREWKPNTCYNCKNGSCEQCLFELTACQTCEHQDMCQFCNKSKKAQPKLQDWCGGIV